MSLSNSRFVIIGALAVVVAACSVRLGGAKPEGYHTVAVEAGSSQSAADIARLTKEAGANIMLLTAERDSAWFAEVARESGLALSGPGTTERLAKAFYTNLKVLGDTSIVLGVADGSRMHMHDALYEISEGRHVDLMLVGVSARSDLREAVRLLLGYIATDVEPNAAIIMAITGPTPQAADSIATLLRAAYTNALECVPPNGGPPAAMGTLRLFYGPSARVQCREARPLTQNVDGGILANLVVSR
jgi:hypothetical protein